MNRSAFEATGVALLVLAGFALRYILIGTQAEIETDGAFFATLAEKISTREATFASRFPPLYSYAIAALAPYCADFEQAGRWVSLVAGTAALPLIYLVGRLLFSPAVGWIALALAAFEPTLVGYASSVLNESTFLFFFLAAVLLSGILLQKKGFLLAAATGIVWGLAYLTRHEGVVYLGILGAALFILAIKRKWPALPTAALILFLLTGFLSVSFPYLRFLKQSTGQWTLSDKAALQLWLGSASVGPDWRERWEKALTGLTDDGTRIEAQQVPVDPELRKKLRPSFREIVRTYVYNVALFLKTGASQFLPPFVWLFLGIGLFLLLGEPQGRIKLGLWSVLLIPLLLLPFFYFEPRYFFVGIPWCLIVAAKGIEGIAAPVKRRWVPAALTAALVVTFLPAAVSAARKGREEGGLSRQVGQWVRTQFPEGVRLMDRHPQIAFYGGAELVTLPCAPWKEILNYARLERAELLVLRKSVVVEKRPWLQFLVDQPAANPHAELIYQAKYQLGGGGDQVWVFRLKP